MAKVCEICNKKTETNGNFLHVSSTSEDVKQEWEICEDCIPAFAVMDEYFQGQN